MSEWISVRERLPQVEIGGLSVVLITDGRTVTIAVYFLKHIDGWTQNRTYAWRAPLTQASEELLWETITHWMPLPNPPTD